MNNGFLKISGIKCNNPSCNFKEEDIPLEDYPEWLERECPECGEILLTENDFNIIKLLAAMIYIANETDREVEKPDKKN